MHHIWPARPRRIPQGTSKTLNSLANDRRRPFLTKIPSVSSSPQSLPKLHCATCHLDPSCGRGSTRAFNVCTAPCRCETFPLPTNMPITPPHVSRSSHGVRLCTLPWRRGSSHELVIMPAYRLENQQATSVPVAEPGSTVTTVECTDVIAASQCIRSDHLHPHQLLNTRGRDSDLMQMCIATLFLLENHLLQIRVQYLLRTPAEVKNTLPLSCL